MSDDRATDDTATAASLDGRTFNGRLAPGSGLTVGDLVELHRLDGGPLLAQVLDKISDPGGVACQGTIIGPTDGQPSVVLPFATATLVPASVEVIEAMHATQRSTMTIGTIRSGTPNLTARLKPGGFNRHTFLCGQSGSGKTYALGVVLERLMLSTAVRIIILDPNGDFVRLGEIRAAADTADADRLREVPLRVLRPRDLSEEPLRARFATMEPQTKAAILQIDPIADRAEYNTFIQRLEQAGGTIEALSMVEALRQGDAVERSLADRLENLDILRWDVWARDRPSAIELIAQGDKRVTVMDLGGFRNPSEPLVVAIDLLDYLWAHREDRVPTLVVVDEAHNICSSAPSSALQAATTQRLIQIAGEGRKFGLWLLLSTQRPSKIHPNVLSQCDNLALMRMNSPGDLLELRDVFGFAPPSMLAASPAFRQGEMLVAGGFIPTPAFVQVGARHTEEGGSDVKVPLST